MQASTEMKMVIGDLALRHRVDLTTIGAWMRLDMPHFDRLVVECIGPARISVAHYWEIEHDLIPAPEIVFVVAGNQWYPISIEQYGSGLQVSAHQDGGTWLVKPDSQKGLADFADEWATNIREQGWIERGELTRVDRGDGRKAA